MEPLDDYPLDAESHDLVAPERREQWRAWAVAALCVAFLAVVAAVFLTRRSQDTAPPPTAAQAAGKSSSESVSPLGPAVEARELPPLESMDPVVRELLSGLSARPALAAWLATDGLIRNLVASIDNVANGTTPARQLRVLRPHGEFRVNLQGPMFIIDPRAYARYDGLADTVASVDAASLARVYSTLRPRLQDAYRELGYPDANVDGAVERAIVRLITVPLPRGDVHVRPDPVLYKFSDQALERLSGAEKQLLRMGPRNGRLVQDKLREVARALGIPQERLSMVRTSS